MLSFLRRRDADPFGRNLGGNWFAPFETALDVQPDRVSNQRARLFLGIAFGVATLKCRTERKVTAVFVALDDDSCTASVGT